MDFLYLIIFIPFIVIGIWKIMDERESEGIEYIMFGLFGLIIFPFFFGGLINNLDKSYGINECLEWKTVDCEIYDIPLDNCTKIVETTGPYWNEKETVRYEGEICAEWKND